MKEKKKILEDKQRPQGHKTHEVGRLLIILIQRWCYLVPKLTSERPKEAFDMKVVSLVGMVRLSDRLSDRVISEGFYIVSDRM